MHFNQELKEIDPKYEQKNLWLTSGFANTGDED